MKYVRATLATTALAVFGLVVAAQNLHSHGRDPQVRPTPIAAPPGQSSAGPVAWIDPPARSIPETTGALASAPPRSAPAAAVPPAAAAAPAEPLRRSTALHRSKGADRGTDRGTERNRIRVAHLRRLAHARTAAAEPAALPPPAPRPAPDASERIDPIGDILRGLGFGRDS